MKPARVIPIVRAKVRAPASSDEGVRLAREAHAAGKEYERAAARLRAAEGDDVQTLLATVALLRAEAAFWKASAAVSDHLYECSERDVRRLLDSHLRAEKARYGRAVAIAERNRARAEEHNRAIADKVRLLTRLETSSGRAIAKRVHTRRSNVPRFRQ